MVPHIYLKLSAAPAGLHTEMYNLKIISAKQTHHDLSEESILGEPPNV